MSWIFFSGGTVEAALDGEVEASTFKAKIVCVEGGTGPLWKGLGRREPNGSRNVIAAL